MCLDVHFSDARSAITYDTSSIVRLGDDIVIYAKAKWLALKNDLDLYYRPFAESHKIALDVVEKKYHPDIGRKFNFSKRVNFEHDIADKQSQPTLYTSHLLTYIPSISNNSLSHSSPPGDTNINDICEAALVDPEFGAHMKKILQPTISLPTLNLPSDKITVALHVRKPSRWDKSLISEQFYQKEGLIPTAPPKNPHFSDVYHPFKFPPLQFYVDQLILLSSLLDDAPMYIFIFTDDNNPMHLQALFEEKCNKSNITFDCRKDENRWDRNIIEDMWELSQFDCLIRSWSHFSSTAQMLGNHKIIIYPRTYFWSDNKLVMDEIFIIIRDPESTAVVTFTLPSDDYAVLGQKAKKIIVTPAQS